MSQNIFKLLYIVAGFIIMLMGLMSFFHHYSSFQSYQHMTQEIQTKHNTWIVEEEWKSNQDRSLLHLDGQVYTYEELVAEIGGYYCFDKKVRICIEDYIYQGIMTEEAVLELLTRLNRNDTYYLKINTYDEELQQSSFIEIIEKGEGI